MDYDAYVRRVSRIADGPRLSSNQDSTLSQLERDATKLSKSIHKMKEKIQRDDALVDIVSFAKMREMIARYQQHSKELRLGGSCKHGADKGPNCVYCFKEGGRLEGPYAGFPDGLEVGDYILGQLGKMRRPDGSRLKKSAKTGLLRELDRISTSLSHIDLTLKDAQRVLQDAEKIFQRLEKHKRKVQKPDPIVDTTRDDDENNQRHGNTEFVIDSIRRECGQDKSALIESHVIIDAEEENTERIAIKEDTEAELGEGSEQQQPGQIKAKPQIAIQLNSLENVAVTLVFFKIKLRFICVAGKHKNRIPLLASQTRDNRKPFVAVDTVRELKLMCEVQLTRLTGVNFGIRDLCLKNSAPSNKAIDPSIKIVDLSSAGTLKVFPRGVTTKAKEGWLASYRLICQNASVLGLKECKIHPGVEHVLKLDPTNCTRSENAVETIDIANLGLSGKDLEPVLFLVCFRNSPLAIDLSGNSLNTYQDLGVIVEWLETLSNIDRFDLHFNTTPSGFDLHRDLVKYHDSAVNLCTTITLKGTESLHHLDLSSINVGMIECHGNPAIGSWPKAICESYIGRINSFEDRFVRLISSCSRLQTLKLNGCWKLICFSSGSSTQKSTCCCTCYKSNVHLKYFQMFCDAIANHPRLECFSFTNNVLPTMRHCASILSAILKAAISTVDFRDNNTIELHHPHEEKKIAFFGTALETIIADDELNQDAMEVDSNRSSREIKQVYLSNTFESDEKSANTIVSALQYFHLQSLQCLDLSACRLQPDHIAMLFAALRNHSSIKQVVARDNPGALDDAESINELTRLVSRNSSLVFLDLADAGFGLGVINGLRGVFGGIVSNPHSKLQALQIGITSETSNTAATIKGNSLCVQDAQSLFSSSSPFSLLRIWGASCLVSDFFTSPGEIQVGLPPYLPLDYSTMPANPPCASHPPSPQKWTWKHISLLQLGRTSSFAGNRSSNSMRN